MSTRAKTTDLDSAGGCVMDELFVVESIHEGSDLCVRRATAEETTEERSKGEGWAMSYESASGLARASARRNGCNWFDFSADPAPQREAAP